MLFTLPYMYRKTLKKNIGMTQQIQNTGCLWRGRHRAELGLKLDLLFVFQDRFETTMAKFNIYST